MSAGPYLEEQHERHERMLSMSITALGGFAKEALQAKNSSVTAPELGDRAEARLGEVLDGASCLAPFAKSPAPALRRAAYTALLCIAQGPRGRDTLGAAGGARRKKLAGRGDCLLISYQYTPTHSLHPPSVLADIARNVIGRRLTQQPRARIACR
jgi:hypothetical protein